MFSGGKRATAARDPAVELAAEAPVVEAPVVEAPVVSDSSGDEDCDGLALQLRIHGVANVSVQTLIIAALNLYGKIKDTTIKINKHS